MLRRFDPEDVVQSVYRSFFRKAENEEFTLKRSGDRWRLLANITIKKTMKRVEFELAKKRDPRVEESSIHADAESSRRFSRESF